MNGTEVRRLDDQQLVERLGEMKEELFNLRFQHATGQLENTARMGEDRAGHRPPAHRPAGAGDRRRGGAGGGEAMSSEAEHQDTPERASRKTREGMVVSTKMDKTLVVSVVERVRHPRYFKTVQRTKKLYVHDEGDDAASATGSG